MKSNEKTVKVKVKPQRLSRAERKSAKLAEKAAAQLELCRQAGEFHLAYLNVELGIEQAYFDEIQARLAELRAEAETVMAIEEEMETFEALRKEASRE